jgi:Trk K+ transport system NAD-binding subunit
VDEQDEPKPGGRGIWARYNLLILAGLCLLTLALGTLGFLEHHRTQGGSLSIVDAIYASLRLFQVDVGDVSGDLPLALQIARFMAPTLGLFAVGGALAGIFRKELHAAALARRKGHAVVCGVGRKASALIQGCHAARIKVVAIDSTPGNRLLRACEDAGDHVLHDDATRPGCLETARVGDARYVFVTTGDDNTNIEIASRVFNLLRGRRRAGNATQPDCYIHLVDRVTHDLFRQHRVFREAVTNVGVHVFNVFDSAARLLWRECLMPRGPLKVTDSRRMHVVIGGLGQLGEAVLLRVVRSGHFANGRKVAVTIVDRDAEAVRERLADRYPMLTSICDLTFLSADIDRPETARRVGAALTEPDQIGTVVLCLDRDYENLAVALRWVPHLGSDVRIYVRLSAAAGLSELLEAERSQAALARQVDGFGLVQRCCALQAVLEEEISSFARSFHAAYVRERLKAGASPSDDAMLPWDELGEAYRESSCEQAEHMEVKLRTYGFTSDPKAPKLPESFDESQVEFLGRMEHARWCAERWLAGWTYGPVKDRDRRISPHLVPWEQVSDSIRAIDFDSAREIPTVLKNRRTKDGTHER